MDKIAILQEKLARLRDLDPDFKIAGVRSHQYKLKPCLTEAEISAFENEHQIQLPADYRNFLLEMGNGGAAPSNGIVPLSAYFDLVPDQADPENNGTFLSSEFPHNEHWNPKPDSDYTAMKQVQGSIAIADEGCGTTIRLVVSGAEKGNIWIDDRDNRYGVRPASAGSVSHADFFTWFNHWLDASIAKLGG